MVSQLPIDRFAIYLVQLDPAIGVEMKKTRPCVVISPDVINRLVRTVIIAPLTSQRREYPMRVACRFEGMAGEIALDQLRAVDRTRLHKRLGKLDGATAGKVRATLLKLFA